MAEINVNSHRLISLTHEVGGQRQRGCLKKVAQRLPASLFSYAGHGSAPHQRRVS